MDYPLVYVQKAGRLCVKCVTSNRLLVRVVKCRGIRNPFGFGESTNNRRTELLLLFSQIAEVEKFGGPGVVCSPSKGTTIFIYEERRVWLRETSNCLSSEYPSQLVPL